MSEGFVQVVGLVAVVFVFAAVARRFGLLAPILLVVAGLALSLILPGSRRWHSHPELVLVGILPPLLYVAALETSVPAFRYNLRPILLLAVGLVVFTAAAVGVAVHALVPEVPLAVCFALGAVVAPTGRDLGHRVGRRIGLPRRFVTILEGESLVNDASALVLFRVAVSGGHRPAVSLAGIALGHAARRRRRPADRGAGVRWSSGTCTRGSPTRCWTTPCRCSPRSW